MILRWFLANIAFPAEFLLDPSPLGSRLCCRLELAVFGDRGGGCDGLRVEIVVVVPIWGPVAFVREF